MLARSNGCSGIKVQKKTAVLVHKFLAQSNGFTAPERAERDIFHSIYRSGSDPDLRTDSDVNLDSPTVKLEGGYQA